MQVVAQSAGTHSGEEAPDTTMQGVAQSAGLQHSGEEAPSAHKRILRILRCLKMDCGF